MDRRSFIKSAGVAVAAAAVPFQLKAGEIAAPAIMRDVRKSSQLQLSFFPYELKLRHAFNLAKYSRTSTPDVQVTLTWNGITGYGEASMPPYLGESVDSVTKFLSSLDLSQFTDPFRMEDILAYVDQKAPKNSAAKASVDIALHDLLGKVMGQPWYKIWGLSPEKTPNTSYTIGIDKPDMVRLKVKEAAPYKVLKVKMGLDQDRETIEVIRSMTNVPICVDVNQGWTDREHALRMIDWLSERNCLFVEQPMPKENIDDIAWLKSRSSLPIIADEAFQRIGDIPKLAEAYDGINIKLMKSTGLNEAYKMIVLGRALGMKIMIGCMTETSCAVSAAAQLAPLVDFADLDGNLLIANDRFSGMTIKDGKITLVDKPGIGITLLGKA